MSNTARITANVNATIDELAVKLGQTFDITMSGTDWDAGTVSVTTSDVQLTVGSGLGTVGWLVLYNADSTNYIRFGKWNSGSGQTYHIRVPPLCAVVVFCDLAANDLSLKADTATCTVHFLALER